MTPKADETAELVGERPDSAAACGRAADHFVDWGAASALLNSVHDADGTVTGTDTVTLDDGDE